MPLVFQSQEIKAQGLRSEVQGLGKNFFLNVLDGSDLAFTGSILPCHCIQPTILAIFETILLCVGGETSGIQGSKCQDKRATPL